MSKVFQIKGLDKVLKDLDKHKEKAIVAIKTNIQASGLDIADDAAQRAPANFGTLKQSYRANPSNSDLTVAIGSDLYYAPFVEFGTRSKTSIPAEFADLAAEFKGGRGGNFEDLLKQIQDWCKRKGIDIKAAWPIAISIARYGTAAQPHLIPAFLTGRERLLSDIKRDLENIK